MRFFSLRRSLPSKFALAALSTLILFAVAEIAARLFSGNDSYETHTGFVTADPDLIWRLTPASEGPLATNELGLRDLPFRADADHTVLVLGDSISWGNGIPEVERVYPQVLERQLGAVREGETFEVINAGVPGYSTFQQLTYLEKYGLALEPDVIVLQFCLNDVVERYRALVEYGGNRHFLGIDTRAAVTGLFGVAIRSSRAFEVLARELQHTARNYDEYRGENLANDKLSRENAAAWLHTLGEINAIRRLTEEHEIPMILLIAPYLFQVQRPLSTRQPQDRLLDFTAGRDIRVIDLLPIFSRASRGRAATLFNDANHFSEEGHSIAAHALVEPVLTALDSKKPTSRARSVEH